MQTILNQINNLRFRTKFIIVTMLILCAIAVPHIENNTVLTQKAAATKSEQKGIEPAAKVIELIGATANFRGRSLQFVNSDTSEYPLRSLEQSLLNSYEDAIQLLKQNEIHKESTKSLTQAKSELEGIVSQISNKQIPSAQLFKQLNAVISKLVKTIEYVLSEHQLMYDSDPSRHHLVMATFIELPQLIDSLGQLRGLGAGLLAKSSANSSEKVMIQSLIWGIRERLVDLNFEFSFIEKGSEKQKDFAREYSSISSNISQLINTPETEILNARKITYDSDAYFTKFSNQIDILKKLSISLKEYINDNLDEYQSDLISKRNTSILSSLAILAIAFAFGVYVIKSIVQPILRITKISSNLANGDYTDTLESNRQDEVGELIVAINLMRNTLKDVDEQAKSNLMVRQSLENSSSNFMLCDTDLNIVFANDSVQNMLIEAESDIREELPQFRAKELLGGNIDLFHKNPSHQRNMLANLRTTHTATIKIGPRYFKLVVNPIIDNEGGLVGNSVEWIDKTQDLEQEQKIARVLAALDNAKTNVITSDESGKIIHVNESLIKHFGKISQDMRATIPNFKVEELIGMSVKQFFTHEQKAQLDDMQTTLEHENVYGERIIRLSATPVFDKNNERIAILVELFDLTEERAAQKEIEELVAAASVGDFSQRSNLDNKRGFLRIISGGLNSLIETTEEGLEDVSQMLSAVSEGDFTKKIDKEYQGRFGELIEYCNTTSESLSKAMSAIAHSSYNMELASREIAQGNSDLSNRTEQQASLLEETTSTMEELTATVQQNTENARSANEIASESSVIAEESGTAIKEVVEKMGAINQSTNEISEIIGVIDSIAFQTNLLALNAAVEAARAGEQGRGFAVVASEVRALAQRSSSAAKDIKTLISSSVTQINDGNKLAHSSGETIAKLVESVKKVTTLMSEIASASQEQFLGIQEVGRAITQLDEVTQQNAALVEEAAATTDNMSQEATRLRGKIEMFKLSGAEEANQSLELLHALPAETPVSNQVPSTTKTFSPAPPEDDEWESF